MDSVVIITLSTCAVESCPTPDDNRGSTSPLGTISGVPSHAVNGRSFYAVHIVSHLVLGFPRLLFPLISRASNHFPFRVPLSPHVQRILKLLVPPSIPVPISILKFGGHFRLMQIRLYSLKEFLRTFIMVFKGPHRNAV